jgi:hypothetical protein
MLLRCIGADTGWYSFGRGAFGFDVSPSLLWAKYAACAAIILLACGMLGRRKWAWVLEGLILWALATLCCYGVFRMMFTGSTAPTLWVVLLSVLFIRGMFRAGRAMMRHGKLLEEQRLRGFSLRPVAN